MTLRGVDISQYDAPVDFARLKAGGIDFAIARCVREATLGIDATFYGHVARAHGAGVIPGAYDFLSHGYASAHAAAFIAAVKAAGGPAGMLLALDIEAIGIVTADVNAWMSPVKAAFPAQPIFQYGSRYNVLGTSSSASNGPLWLADYGANPAGTWDAVYAARGGDAAAKWTTGFNGWPGPTIWQFGSKGVVPGLGRSIGDIDAFRGTFEDMQALAGITTQEGDDLNPNKELPVAIADIGPTTVYGDVDGKKVDIANWAGATAVGIYSKPAPGSSSAAMPHGPQRIRIGPPVRSAWVDAAAVSNVRVA